MGARVYNPATGVFLSPDPVADGNTTRYGYPQDPVNEADDSGACPICIIPVIIGGVEPIGALVATAVIAGVTIYAYETVRANGITIPMPGKKKEGKGPKKWKVYEIEYYNERTGGWPTWKYGITSRRVMRVRLVS